VQVIEKNTERIDPIIVTNLACACLRGFELQTCGSRPAIPGDNSNICGPQHPEVVCPEDMPCGPTFGPGNSAAGKFGCNGITDTDYLVTADHDTGETSFVPSGGPVSMGAISYAYTAIGTILDGGLCNMDTTDDRKGPDGIPCTLDDPEASVGTPALQVQTTGTAQANVLNVNGQSGKNIDADSTCGTAALCVTSATGAAKSCDDLLADDTAGFCLASAFAQISAPSLGDIVTPSKFCALAQ